MKKVGLLTLGCAKNQVDSEIMLGVLEKEGYQIVDDFNKAQVLIVNTCGFISDAKEESIESIFSLAKYKTEGICEKLIVSGCLAQRYKDELKEEIPEVDGFLGTGEMDQIITMISDSTDEEAEIKNSYFFDYSQELPKKNLSDDYTSYVKIAEGCNNNCSYCVIPQLRGPLKSREISSIKKEVKALAEDGVKEVNIIAQDITQYGVDLAGEAQLVKLLEELLEIEGIQWFRLLYAYSDYLNGELIDLIAREDRICNYLDLPIQHVNQKIRKQMNRKGNKEDIMRKITNLREQVPDIALRTSIIVGFPGETESDFAELLSFVKEVEFDRLGVFTYSQEEGTPAAEMEAQIDEKVKEERREKLMQVQQKISHNRNKKLIAQVVKVLIEEVEADGLRIGRTQWDAPEVDGGVYVKNSEAEIGDMIEVEITEAYEYDLMGEEN